MRTKEIEFVRYLGFKHPLTGRELEDYITYYAVPGGSISTRDKLIEWGKAVGTFVRFRDYEVI